MPLHLIQHPLVHDALATLRDASTPPALFRRMAERISLLLAAEATADLPSERGTVLTPLGPAEARRVTGDVVVVPEKALTTFAGITKLFVIADGKAEERIVRTGVAIDGAREIADGVSQGEQVAVTNLDRLEQGAPVIVAQP